MSLHTDIQTAIATEIAAQRRKSHTVWITVDRIDLLREEPGRFIHRLELGQDLRVVSDTELVIKVPGQKETYTVQVLLCDGSSLVIVSQTRLPTQMTLVRVQFDPTFILERLAADLAGVLDPPSFLVQALLNRTFPLPDHMMDDVILQRVIAHGARLNQMQRTAVVRMQADAVHVLWGPPGTGKTATLGASIAEHLGAGKTCLLLSTSNAAVDELVKATVPNVGMTALETIFRTGVSANNEVERLTAIGYFRRKHPAWAARADAAQRELAVLTSSLGQRAVGGSADTILKDIQGCKATISSYMEGAKLHGEDVIKHAPCVAATLASMVINGVLAERTFDVVYLDEASMVALPFALAAAARARQQLIVGGDFQQLPPVCHADDPRATDWFARNIFDHINLSRTSRLASVPPYVTMLREQYRMTQTIATLVSDLSYGGRLVSGQGIQVGVRPILINVGGMYATSHYSVETKSYYHPASALLLHTLRRHFSDWLGPRNLLLSPFRAQQALLTAVAKDIATEHHQFEALTIHKAQGSQEDTVIVDLTAHDATNPQKFFTGEETENLINVALSRAQQRLIIIGNLDMIRDLARQGGYWARFWTLASNGCTHIDARDVLASATNGGDVALGLRALGAERDEPHLPAVYVENAEFLCPAGVQHLFMTNRSTTKLLVRRKRGGTAPSSLTQRHDPHGTVPPLTLAQGVLALPVQRGMQRGRWLFAAMPETTKQVMFLACGHLLDGRFEVEDTLRLQCGGCGHGLVLRQQYGDAYLTCSQSGACGYTRRLSMKDARVLVETHRIRCSVCQAQAQPRMRHVERSVFLGCSNYPACNGKIDLSLYVD